MKLFLSLAVMAIGALAQSVPTTVFVMPMPGGLDQYLAVHLSSSGAYRVITDPKEATLLLTDRVGESLETTLKEFDAPVPVAGKETSKDADNFTRPRMLPLTHARGTLFLVDRASHQVLWSTFEEQKMTDPKSLNSSAKRVVDRMTKARATK